MSYLLLITFQLFFSACPSQFDDSIMVYNNMEHEILVDYGYFNGPIYPDTTLPQYNYMHQISEKKSHMIELYYSLEKTYQIVHRDTLSFYIFHADTVKKYKWDEVRDGYKILKRYDLSLQDIKQLNKSVYYPPTEEMKNMKMYPPYEEK